MKTYPFQLDRDNNVILVEVQFDKSKLIFLLDTGASHSIIDLSSVLIAGYDLVEMKESVEVETANGIIEAKILKINRLASLGIEKHKMKVMSYDFIGSGLFTNFDGVLGIDFFQDNKVCIDFVKSEISIS